MTSRYQVWLDQTGLHQLAPSICVLDVAETAPVLRLHTEQNDRMDGQRLLHSQRVSLSVSVSFAIRDTNPSARQAALDLVRGWARRGGMLMLSTRPGKVLPVVPSHLPAIESADDWTAPLTVTFIACEQPYWQELTPAAAQLTGSGEAELFVPGSAESTVCELRAVNQGTDACQQLTIHCGETCFTFEALGLLPGETLRCVHDRHGYVQMSITSTDDAVRSAYQARTPGSDDDLLLPCGETSTVSVVSDAPLTVTLEARGRWV